ncbi:hypothetical protein FXO38_10384 [Capsicum annuum]|nr:hypothetical protein FXO38_10384 [Capsicum annuum]
MVELSVQAAEHQATCKTLSCVNNLLNKSLDEIIKRDSKGKAETVKKVVKLVEKLVVRKWDGKVYAHNKRLMFSDILVVGMGNGAMRVLGYVGQCGLSTM